MVVCQAGFQAGSRTATSDLRGMAAAGGSPHAFAHINAHANARRDCGDDGGDKEVNESMYDCNACGWLDYNGRRSNVVRRLESFSGLS